LSGIFLPLNLIVGFFGMNTTSLPFASELGGTHIVMWILFSVIVVSFGIIIYAKKMKIKD
jgi:magnesium transporter